LIFFSCYIGDVYLSLLSKTVNEDDKIIDNSKSIWISFILKGICTSLLGYFMSYEIKSARKQPDYFNEVWNYIDICLIAFYIPVAVLDYLDIAYIPTTILQVLIVSLAFTKINFFLRVFDGFSFIVTMMSGVFIDIQYFMGFWVVFLAYFLMSFRLSAGDFELDAYSTQRTYLILITWLIWIVGVVALNMVFMNFIIALISDSYARVMEKSEAESYKVKANMIVEREIHFT